MIVTIDNTQTWNIPASKGNAVISMLNLYGARTIQKPEDKCRMQNSKEILPENAIYIDKKYCSHCGVELCFTPGTENYPPYWSHP